MNKEKNIYYRLPIFDGLELLDAKHHTQNFPFHTHNTFNITLILDQVFSTRLTTCLLHAPGGTIVITNPHEVHATICESKIGSSFFTFYVSPDLLKSFANNKHVFFTNKIIYDNVLFQKLYVLSQNFKNPKVEIEHDLTEALKQLTTNYASYTEETEIKNKFFQTFLEEESFEKFSLENTASKFSLDKYKFLRLFKQQTGLTPNSYIILKRIEKCKELLQTQDDLLGIAIQTGFYDATHLCKYFKKITGITPLAYRHA